MVEVVEIGAADNDAHSLGAVNLDDGLFSAGERLDRTEPTFLRPQASFSSATAKRSRPLAVSFSADLKSFF